MKLLRKNENLLLAGFIFIFLLVAFYLSYHLDFYEDEIYSLKSTQGNILSSFKQAIFFEGQQPLYFVFLNLWRSLGSGIFVARLFSVCAVACSILLIYKLSKIYFVDFNPLFMVMLFVFNPFVLWAATEARLYALALLISLLLIYFFYKGFQSQTSIYKYRALFYLTAFISFYTFYYFAFLLFALGFILLINKRYKGFIYYTGMMVLLIIPYLFIYKLIMSQISLISFQGQAAAALTDRLRIILRGTQHYLFSYQMLSLGKLFTMIVSGLLTLAVLWGLYKFFVKLRKKQVIISALYQNLILTTLVVYLLYFLVLAALPQLNFNERYMVLIYPVLTILFVGFIKLTINHYWALRIVIFLVVLVFFIANIFQFHRLIKVYDYKAVNAYIENNTKDEDPVLFYRSCHAPIISQYYRGNDKFIPLPDSTGYTTDYLSAINSAQQLDSIFQKLDHKYNRFSLISDDQVDHLYSVNLNRNLLYQYIKTNFIIENDHKIYGKSDDFYFRILEFRKRGN